MISKLTKYVLALGLVLAPVFSHALELTPEQQRQLDALPASQKQQLIDQYQSFRQSNNSSHGSKSRDQRDTSVNRQEGLQPGVRALGAPASTDSSETQQQSSPARANPESAEDVLRKEYEQWKEASSLSSDELLPFGYELFAGEPESYVMPQDVPVPAGYRVGPGDEIRVLLTGRQNQDLSLIVDRSGRIKLPEIGPLNVHGKTLEELRSYIDGVVSEKFIGVESFVSLGELRSINVFVTGESRNPGVYALNAFSSISHALSVSGGIRMSGTLRDVRLIRDGKVIASLDLYNLLLNGNLRNNHQLKAGDVVFIPAVGNRVSISGSVTRPAVYEVGSNATMKSAIELAGGLRAEADPKKIQVSRITPGNSRTLIDVPPEEQAGFRIVKGDEVRVGKVRDWLNGVVELKGATPIAGQYEWFDGMRVSDLISDREAKLNVDADLQYGLIISRLGDSYKLAVSRFRPRSVLSAPGSPADPRLRERDTVLIFNKMQSIDKAVLLDRRSQNQSAEKAGNTPTQNNQNQGSREVEDQKLASRQALLAPLIEELRANLTPGKLAPVVTVSGAVKYPGSYPLLDGDTVKDLIREAGGLTNASYQMEAELIRQTLTPEKAVTKLLPLSLDAQADLAFRLAPTDQLHIKQLPDLNLQKTVKIDGEVRFPGTYTIRPGETLSQVVKRAGGLTEYAYPRGAVFTRESLRIQEQQRLNDAERRLSRDIALTGPEQAGEQSTLGSDKAAVTQVLDKVAKAQAVGRLVIDLPGLLGGRPGKDVRLQSGDTLTVPEVSQAVTVMGEVQYATSHLYDPDLGITDYIQRSGGLALRADEERIYVIRADGSVTVPNTSRWFGQPDPVEPGDTIVVPLDLTQISSLELAKDLSQIVYQIALGVSAVNSLGN